MAVGNRTVLAGGLVVGDSAADFPREFAIGPRPAENLVVRAALAAALAGLLDVVLSYQTGTLPFVECVAMLAPHLAVAAALAAPSLIVHWRWRALTIAADCTSLAGLIGGMLLLFAVRRGSAHPELLARPFVGELTWGLTAVLTAIAILLIARGLSRGGVSHARFLAVATCTYVPAAGALAFRTLSSEDLSKVVTAGPAVIVIAASGIAIAACLLRRESRVRSILAIGVLLASTTGVSWVRGSTINPPGVAGVRPRTSASPRLPGILVITLDTLRRDHLSLYGYGTDTSPNLRAFSEHSLVFDGAYASSPYTLSSHASLFTGLLPSEHGAHKDALAKSGQRRLDFALMSGLPTLADRLAERGYRTAGIAANFGYLSPWTGLSRGFAQYCASARRQYVFFPLLVPVLTRAYGELRRDMINEGWPADAVTDAALRWIRADAGVPFFLFLNYLDVHEYTAMFPPLDGHRLTSAGPLGRDRLVASYDAQIAIVDREVGRLLDGLHERGLLDRMLVVITSDHGEYLGDHGLWGHGHDLHEAVLQIPLVVKLPGQEAGARIPDRITHQGIFSLVLDAEGGATPAALQRALANPPTAVVAESWMGPVVSRSVYDGHFPWRLSRAVYGGRFKLIERVGAESELYDLSADPHEERDLFAAEPELARKVAAELLVGLPPMHVEPPSDLAAAGDVESLRALGYVGP